MRQKLLRCKLENLDLTPSELRFSSTQLRMKSEESMAGVKLAGLTLTAVNRIGAA